MDNGWYTIAPFYRAVVLPYRLVQGHDLPMLPSMRTQWPLWQQTRGIRTANSFLYLGARKRVEISMMSSGSKSKESAPLLAEWLKGWGSGASSVTGRLLHVPRYFWGDRYEVPAACKAKESAPVVQMLPSALLASLREPKPFSHLRTWFRAMANKQ